MEFNKTDQDYEDRLLVSSWGPTFVWVGSDEGPIGVGIRRTGRMDVYEPFVLAGDRLAKAGLLEAGAEDGTPIRWYKFTERGKIAHWALREAVRQ